MKKLIKISLMLCLTFMATSYANAQKFGYINSQLLLSEMSEVKEMRANLTALQTQLQKKGQGMLTAYQAKEADAVQRKERGEMSPVEEETILKNLQEEQKKIMEFEQDMQRQIGEKEQSLLKPILDCINTAIDQVATEDAYTFIFDSSTGVLLFADEKQDVTAAVKTKLGI